MNRKLLAIASLAVGLTATSIASVTFSNFSFDPAAFPTGPVVSGNSLTLLPATANAGDASTARSQTLAFAYDVSSTTFLRSATTLGQTFTLGSGVVSFQQSVYDLDDMGSLVGTGSVTTAGSTLAPETVVFSNPSKNLHVVNTFTLAAPDTAAFDYAGLSLVNQNVQPVPEPASWIALAVGATAWSRRRTRR